MINVVRCSRSDYGRFPTPFLSCALSPHIIQLHAGDLHCSPVSARIRFYLRCETTQMLYCYCEYSFLSFFLFISFFSTFPPFACARFVSVETSAIDSRLQHKVENGLGSHRNIFFGNLTKDHKIRPLCIKKYNAPPLSVRKMSPSHCTATACLLRHIEGGGRQTIAAAAAAASGDVTYR